MSISRTRIQPVNFLQKAVENIITLTPTVSANTTLSNGNDATFTITTVGTSTNRTQVGHDWTLYLTSVANANKFPNGSNINMSQWVVTPFVNDWGDTDNINTVTKIYVRNVSAGASQTVIIEAQARLIQNSTTLGGTA